MRKINKLALAVAVASTSGLSAVPSAHAQLSIEEVVVTARKRDEVIQDVPVAITAVTGETLERSVLFNFEDATRLTPGFTVPQNSSSPLNLSLSMRGSVQTDGIITMDPSVGVYVDDVYIARTYGIGVDLLDLEGVQVLKGPQGTLFGRNSTAGAMLLNSRNPELGLFEGSVSATGGPDLSRVSGIVNVPIGDTAAIRIAMQDSERDDYIDNRALPNAASDPRLKNWDTKLGGKETQSYRAKLRWAPIEPLDMVLTWDKFEATDRTAGPQLWRTGTPQPHKEDVTGLNFDNMSAADTETITFVATYALDDWELKFLASDREWRDMREMDYDGGDLAGATRHGTWGREAGDQQSFEFQVTGSLFDERVDLVAGVLYFKEFGQLFDYSYGFNPLITSPFAPGVIPGFVGGNYVENNVESLGYYTQATIHLTDVSNLTVGLRYTSDEKDGKIYGESSNTASFMPPTWDFSAYKAQLQTWSGSILAPTYSPVGLITPSEEWDSVDWMISYDHRISDAVMVYGKVSTGFRAGGFNGRGARLDVFGNPLAPLIYNPEEVIEYEVGFKSDFFDRRLRLNAAVYYNETDEKQMTTILPPNVAGTAPGTTILNAGKAEAKGLELEFTYLISDNWSIGGSYAYIDAEVTEKSDALGNKLPSNELPLAQFIPENQFTLALNYDQEFESFKLAGTLTYSWIDEILGDQKSVTTLVKDSATGYSVTNPSGTPTLNEEQARSYLDAVTSDSYGLFNLNLTVSPLDDQYNVTFWVKNLMDERKIASTIGFIAGNTYQYVRGVYTEPRMWGVTATYNF